MQWRTTSGWPRAVVFDLDGTLIDSAGDLATALNALLQRESLRPHTLDEVRGMIGGGVPVLLQSAFQAQNRTLSEAAARDLSKDFLAIYSPRATERTALYQGAVGLLDQLRQAGVKLAICTNKPTAISERILAHFGLADHFEAVVGAEEGRPRKPDPAPLRLALRQLGVTPGETVMIGDSGADVSCARAADLPVIVVSYGYTRTPAAELGADRLIDALGEVPAVLAALAPLPQT